MFVKSILVFVRTISPLGTADRNRIAESVGSRDLFVLSKLFVFYSLQQDRGEADRITLASATTGRE
jgi:hypothetical protein